MAELLLELLSEEIPARMQAPAADDLREALLELIHTKLGFATDGVRAFVTPRRLVAVADGLPTVQPDVVEERRGPRVGAPDKAIAGFLRAAGLESLDQCEQREDKKGAFHYAVLKRKGRPTAAVLAEEIPALIENFSWPKSMRWGQGSLRWVRPLHAILCLFDGAVVPGRLVIGDTAFAFVGSTHGHRWMAPETFAVRDFADYRSKLEDAKVVLDAGVRRRRIAEQAEALAARAGLALTPDVALLDEVCGLVEWPVCLLGSIDQAFMALPPEVLTTVMRSHQKYFALADSEGRLANRFIVVANIEADDGGAAIRTGNERVLRARLHDARFFWDHDRAQSLESRVGNLDRIVFHAKLGSLGEKVRRLEALAPEVAEHVPGASAEPVARAARLCKADLFTGMVGEFPELQGVMGRYLALHDGDARDVADAITEHYAPRGPGDRCPAMPISVAVALADKIDTLVGFFAIKEKPTGSKDPFALRRAALGVIRLVLENNIRLPLRTVFLAAFRYYLKCADRIVILYRKDGFTTTNHQLWIDKPENNFEQQDYDLVLLGKTYKFTVPGKSDSPFDENQFIGQLRNHQIMTAELLDFFADRMKVVLNEKGVRHDLISAVFATTQAEMIKSFGMAGEVDLVRILARVNALDRFLDTDNGANLLVAYRRAANIVRIEEKRDGTEFKPGSYDPEFADGNEKKLWDALEKVMPEINRQIENEKFIDAMESLSRLRQPLDLFFDTVTVNVKALALRKNRLSLLAYIVWVMNQVADFSRIEGGDR